MVLFQLWKSFGASEFYLYFFAWASGLVFIDVVVASDQLGK
jgi:hypothetical protein